jgi:hypothetical protein
VKDVSAIFDHFRVSARDIWNRGFWPVPDFQNWDSSDVFQEIRMLLFEEFVLTRLDLEWPREKIFLEPIPFFNLGPKSQTGSALIQRSASEHGYWDHPIREIKAGEAELHFVDYFDWDQMDYQDFQYYRAKIASFPAHPETVGLEVLLEHRSYFVSLTGQESTKPLAQL